MHSALVMQEKHPQWAWQWDHIYDDNQWLFTEWIFPNTLETFRGKDVLDCGCGGGQHINFVSPYALSVTGVDLNALSSAAKNTANLKNVTLKEDDLATMDLGRQYDIAYSIGVLHHTDDPTVTFRNILKHVKPGGKMIVWVYSYEGNFWNRRLLEPLKTLIVYHLPRPVVMGIAHVLTSLLYLPIYTIYLLPAGRSLGEGWPLRFLPFYEYFQNWRKLSYERNLLNVFDKLNAPQTHFITREQIAGWFSPEEFADIHISPYRGVSWRGSGTRKR